MWKVSNKLILLQFVAYKPILAPSLPQAPAAFSPLTPAHDSDPASNTIAASNAGNTKSQTQVRKQKGPPEAEVGIGSSHPTKKLKSNAPKKEKAAKSTKKMPDNSKPNAPATEPTHDDASTSVQPGSPGPGVGNRVSLSLRMNKAAGSVREWPAT